MISQTANEGYTEMLTEVELRRLYLESNLSALQIAALFSCSAHKVNYWMQRYGIEKRTISEAVYVRQNPNGDPFKIKAIETIPEAELFGIGLGLYWGEGNKKNKWSIKLGNTDPALLKIFMDFLIDLFGAKKSKFRFTLQIFTDIDSKEALEYWVHALGVDIWQFGKPTVTISGSIGTYRQKSRYGVVTVCYHNKKLRDILVSMLPR